MTNPTGGTRVGLGLAACSGTRASRLIGDGQRIMYLDWCDGTTLAVHDGQGREFSLKRQEVRLLRVYGQDGKPIRHELNPEDGHLLVYRGQQGEDELWGDVCAWERHDPAEDRVGKARKIPRRGSQDGWME